MAYFSAPIDNSSALAFRPELQPAGNRGAPCDRGPSTRGRIVVDQRVRVAATVEGSHPLDRVMPVQHGLEAILFLLFDLGHVKLSHMGQGLAP